MATNPTESLPVGVLVFLKLKDQAGIAQFVEDFEPLHTYVSTKETHTLVYELHHKKDDPLSIIIIEKYQTEKDLVEIHNKSEAFTTFVEKLGKASYVDSLEIVNTQTVNEAKILTHTAGKPSTKGDGILVFCGARNGKNPAHVAAGTSMGTAIAKRGRTLVYGGGTVGIMGAVVTAALENKGAIKSVIPRSMMPREVSGEMVGDITYTHTMAERKSVMFHHSNTVIALPGGLGTFDELLETITLLQLNAYRPKIGILNAGGFFDAFFVFLRHLIGEGYVEEHIFDYIVVENSGDGEALLAKLDAFEVPPSILPLAWTSPLSY